MGGVAGLEGGLLHRTASMRYIRQRLWDVYAPTRQTIKDANIIHILMLQKNTSHWRINSSEVNLVLNWNKLEYTVKSIEGVQVVSIIPQVAPFHNQIQSYRNADITISLWGGISTLNYFDGTKEH